MEFRAWKSPSAPLLYLFSDFSIMKTTTRKSEALKAAERAYRASVRKMNKAHEEMMRLCGEITEEKHYNEGLPKMKRVRNVAKRVKSGKISYNEGYGQVLISISTAPSDKVDIYIQAFKTLAV